VKEAGEVPAEILPAELPKEILTADGIFAAIRRHKRVPPEGYGSGNRPYT